MSEKDLGEGLEKLDEEIENLKNKEFRLFGVKVTAVTIGAAMTLISTGIGGLYGAFVVYQDYMDMKEQIQSYVAPDLSGFQEQLSVMDQKLMSIEDIVIQSSDFTRDIRTDLKGDIQRIEQLTDDTDRRVKDIQRNIDDTLRQMEALNRETEKDVRDTMRETEDRIDADMRQLETDLNIKLQEALDNPLNN